MTAWFGRHLAIRQNHYNEMLPRVVNRLRAHGCNPRIQNPLIAGALLLLFTFAGRYLIQFAFPVGDDEPTSTRVESKSVARADGTNIHAEIYGPVGAPILVLTHGWGTSSTEWYYAKRHLSDRFQLILWDLPGLGKSAQACDRNFVLERMASDLHAVLSLAGGRPVVLVGHSIGGMINLTFCRLYPELVGSQIAGIAQLDTTYTNPVKTTKGLPSHLQSRNRSRNPFYMR
jgi:hypothetical protein